MYLQLNERDFTGSALAVLNRLPSFFDFTHRHVDEATIGAPVSDLGDLVGWIEQLPFELAAGAVSFLAGLVHERGVNQPDQLDLARQVFGVPVLHEPIVDAIRSNRAGVVVASQTVTGLARLIVLYADATARPPRRVDELVLERAILGTAALGGLFDEEPTDKTVLARLVQLGAVNAGVPVLETLSRWFYLYCVLAESEDARNRSDYSEVAAWSVERYGLTLGDQVVLAFAAIAATNALDAPNVSQPYGRVGPGWCQAQAEQLGVDPAAVQEILSAPREWYGEQFEQWRRTRGLTDEQAAGAFNNVPFDSRPFLRLEDGSLLLWSPRALINWASEGFFHRLHACGKTHRRDKHFRGFHAWLVERYCLDLVRDALPTSRLPGSGVVSGDKAYRTRQGGRRSPDISIDCGTDLILLEITSGRLTADARSLGTADAVDGDLGRLIVGKATQLSDRIDDLLAGRFEVDRVDLAHVERIWPVVVTASGLFMTEPLWNELVRRIGGALRQPRVGPLAVMDVYDLEVLAGLIEQGHSVRTLLEAKTDGPYRALDWSRMLFDDPRFHPRRASSVERRADAMFDGIAERLGFDPEQFERDRRAA